ncbi:MAG TPA: dTDP-4-amino-4,6-dideoxygalactose transaminase [Polyangiaceae bacterium]|nr:dTDP-4-amino-4,6-dideoxygalactose transaminase [Polyangiaceae bacterium]
MAHRIPFNRPHISGKELEYVSEAIGRGEIAADGRFSKGCARIIQERFKIARALMMPSCTAGLEMAALLCDVQPGDEVIMPSYTFVSTANAFVRSGARPVFVDIRPDTLNLNENEVEAAITPRTKAIVPVHYAGVGCEMDALLEIAKRHELLVVEDAAQGVHAYYKGRALGSLGDLSAYSFHDTKNYVCGEGGALTINNPALIERAEIIRDKGTNRQKFFRGEVDKYTWVDIGSSFLPAEIACAFLHAQLEQLDPILERRRAIHEGYAERLQSLERAGLLRGPRVPEHCRQNYHMYYVLLRDEPSREGLAAFLRERGIQAVSHYVPLHLSPMGRRWGYVEGSLPVTEDLSARLLRLPLFYGLSSPEQDEICSSITEFLQR